MTLKMDFILYCDSTVDRKIGQMQLSHIHDSSS